MFTIFHSPFTYSTLYSVITNPVLTNIYIRTNDPKLFLFWVFRHVSLNVAQKRYEIIRGAIIEISTLILVTLLLVSYHELNEFG